MQTIFMGMALTQGKQHQHEQHKREVTPMWVTTPMCKNNVRKTKRKLKKQKQNQCKKNTTNRKNNYKERWSSCFFL